MCTDRCFVSGNNKTNCAALSTSLLKHTIKAPKKKENEYTEQMSLTHPIVLLTMTTVIVTSRVVAGIASILISVVVVSVLITNIYHLEIYYKHKGNVGIFTWQFAYSLIMYEVNNWFKIPNSERINTWRENKGSVVYISQTAELDNNNYEVKMKKGVH